MTTCPRCVGEKTRLEHEGRENDAVLWRIFYCLACSFSWRDSEPPSAIDPAIRDRDFRVDPSGHFATVLAPNR